MPTLAVLGGSAARRNLTVQLQARQAVSKQVRPCNLAQVVWPPH